MNEEGIRLKVLIELSNELIDMDKDFWLDHIEEKRNDQKE